MQYKRRHHNIKYKFFTKENDTISTQNIFLAANIPSNMVKVVFQNARGPNAGGEGYFHDTTFRTQQPKHIFFFYFIINQPN